MIELCTVDALLGTRMTTAWGKAVLKGLIKLELGLI